MRAQRSAKGLCLSCGKRQQFWGIRCVVCRELCSRRALPRTAVKAIRRYRDLETQRKLGRLKAKIRNASRALLTKGHLTEKYATALRLYVGLDKHEWRTYRQVAKIMNVSTERIRQLLLPSKAALEAELDCKISWRKLTSSAKGEPVSTSKTRSHESQHAARMR